MPITYDHMGSSPGNHKFREALTTALLDLKNLVSSYASLEQADVQTQGLVNRLNEFSDKGPVGAFMEFFLTADDFTRVYLLSHLTHPVNAGGRDGQTVKMDWGQSKDDSAGQFVTTNMQHYMDQGLGVVTAEALFGFQIGSKHLFYTRSGAFVHRLIELCLVTRYHFLSVPRTTVPAAKIVAESSGAPPLFFRRAFFNRFSKNISNSQVSVTSKSLTFPALLRGIKKTCPFKY